MSKIFLFQAIQFSQTVLIQTIQFSISIVFVYTQLIVQIVLFQTIQFGLNTVSMSKTVPFLTIQFSISAKFKYQNSSISKIQFSISTQFSSIWPIDRTVSVATTAGKSGPGSDGNKGILRIPQSSSITGTSPSDCLVLYPGHSLGWILPLYREAVGVFYSPSRHVNASKFFFV